MTFNLSIILSESAAAAPDRTVAFFAGGQLSYGELDALSDKCAAGLADHGLRPGDKVALQLPNIPQFLIAYFGILRAGCVVVPLNVMLKSAEVEFQLADSGARTLITREGILAEAAKGAAAAGLGDIYAVGHPAGAPDAIGFEQLLARAAGRLQVPAAHRFPLRTAQELARQGSEGRAGRELGRPTSGAAARSVPRLADDYCTAAADKRLAFLRAGRERRLLLLLDHHPGAHRGHLRRRHRVADPA
jgi:long-chain acyl-CoA synthetase